MKSRSWTLWPLLLLSGIGYCGAQLEQVASSDRVLFCHVTNWAQARPAPWAFGIDDIDSIDPFLCTHLIYSFVNVDQDKFTLKAFEPAFDLDDGQGAMRRLTSLKSRNKRLKTLVNVGGFTAGGKVFSDMAKANETRAAFINSTVDWCRQYDFDGVDISWIYPGVPWAGGIPEDKDNFGLLLDEMRPVFDKNGLSIVISASPIPGAASNGYAMESLRRNADFVKVITFDYHGAWENFTHHHAPMFPSILPEEHKAIVQHTVSQTIEFWKDKIPSTKLVMGIAAYGRGYTVSEPFRFFADLILPSMGPIPSARYTKSPGVWSYFEICSSIYNMEGCPPPGCLWVPTEDMGVRAPYAFLDGGNWWVAYDDRFSVQVKANFAKNHSLAGVFVWSLDMDDFRGEACYDGTYPLTNSIRKTLGIRKSSEDDTPGTTSTAAPTKSSTETSSTSEAPATTEASTASTTTTTESTSTTTTATPNEAGCSKRGRNAYPDKSCTTTFYICSERDDRYVRSFRGQMFRCTNGLYFDGDKAKCVAKEDVEKCN